MIAVPVWTAVGAWALLGAHASWTDLRHAVISRRACWTAGAVIAAMLAATALALGDPYRCLFCLGATAAVAVPADLVYRYRPGAIGYGDIRLITANSLLLSWWGPAWPWWALLAGAIAAWPQALVSFRRSGRQGTIRWAPALTAGTALVLAVRLAAVGTLP